MRVIFGVSLLILLHGLAWGIAAAQVKDRSVVAESTAADSVRANRASRSAQSDFERLRRMRMPETWPRGGGTCDERIGRFCLTHDDDEEEWVAPPEDPELVAARHSLIAVLTDAARRFSGDGWVVGQRVRYLVEARRFGEAVQAASECRADESWCAAVAGFAFHYASRPAQADSAFQVALSAMHERERGQWNDLELILEGASSRAYRRLQGDERAAFEERFWRLADPFVIRPGNELRSEHLARHVMSQFQERAQSPDGVHWGSDLREILIRYGWPVGWERVRQTAGLVTHDASFISHYSSAPQNLLPPPAPLLGDTTAAGVWDVELRRARTGYDLPFADSVGLWFHPLAHQFAVFRRGTDALVAAAYELPADSTPPDVQALAGLALVAISDSVLTEQVTTRNIKGRHGSLMASATAPLLVSLEILIPETRRMARARQEVRLAPLVAGSVGISDLLLIRSEAPLPNSLSAAIERALATPRVGAGDELGIYWELYGAAGEGTAGDGLSSVTMSLRLLEERAGWLSRLAVRAGILREAVPIRLRWQEPIPAGEFSSRSLSLRIPDVSPGEYVLELSAEVTGREPITARRAIQIVARP